MMAVGLAAVSWEWEWSVDRGERGFGQMGVGMWTAKG
jgi:hypothetical protein